MLKHILLPMKVRHLTGNAELVTMLNRFGQTQSYTRTMQLETAMCSAVIASESTLPPNISPDKNSFLHLCWENFDLNEETSSGSGITHSTRGIIIQEVADRSKIVSTESQLTKSRERTVKPNAIDIKPCYAKLKSEAKFGRCQDGIYFGLAVPRQIQQSHYQIGRLPYHMLPLRHSGKMMQGAGLLK